MNKLVEKGIDFITDRRYRIYLLEKSGFFDFMEDEKYIRIMFKARLGKELNLENPTTFNEKLQWLKLYDRRPEYIEMVDKYAAKKYAAQKIGNKFIIPTLGVWNYVEEIDFDALPSQFVLKCTHDSGGIVICRNRETFQYDKAKKKLSKHLKVNYYLHGREWPYKYVKPRILAEPYMEDAITRELRDYKFYTFNGKCRVVLIATGRGSKEGVRFDFFDMDFNHLPFCRGGVNADKDIAKPVNFELMIQLAEDLSKGTFYLRVDFYEINGKLYFGEFTFYPSSGMEPFEPDSWDEEFGSWLKLPERQY